MKTGEDDGLLFVKQSRNKKSAKADTTMQFSRSDVMYTSALDRFSMKVAVIEYTYGEVCVILANDRRNRKSSIPVSVHARSSNQDMGDS